jgi:hypothetical protein
LGLCCVHSPLPLTVCRVTIIINFFANVRARQHGNRDKYEVSITAIASYFDVAAWVWIPVFYIDIDLRGVGRKAAREGTVVNNICWKKYDTPCSHTSRSGIAEDIYEYNQVGWELEKREVGKGKACTNGQSLHYARCVVHDCIY